MGEFRAGTWLIGISIYFFLFFTVVFSVVAAGAEHATAVNDISFKDPGFVKRYGSSRCFGDITTYCFHTNANDNSTCNDISGCSFQTIGNREICTGQHSFQCSNATNQSFCYNLGCNWATGASVTGLQPDLGNEAIDPNAPNPTFTKIKSALSIITGINSSNVKIGLPGTFQFIFSFFLFWIPSFAWLFALYMSLPFLH